MTNETLSKAKTLLKKLDIVIAKANQKIKSHSSKAQKFLEQKLDYIHKHKTAKMIEVSLKAGAVLSNASPAKIKALSDYGRKIGFAFQIVDDVLDITGVGKKLGKSTSDIKNKKLTYPSIYGITKSKQKAAALIESAKNDLKVFGKKADVLNELADYIIKRDF